MRIKVVLCSMLLCNLANVASAQEVTVIGSGSKTQQGSARLVENVNCVRLRRKIKANWKPPRDGGAAVVSFVVRQGVISDLRLERSSGNADSDRAALKAVSRTFPWHDTPFREKQISFRVDFGKSSTVVSRDK